MVSLIPGKTYRAIAGEINRNISAITGETAFYLLDCAKYSAQDAHQDALRLRTRKHSETKIACKKELVNFINNKLQLKWSPMQISKNLKKVISSRTSYECEPLNDLCVSAYAS